MSTKTIGSDKNYPTLAAWITYLQTNNGGTLAEDEVGVLFDDVAANCPIATFTGITPGSYTITVRCANATETGTVGRSFYDSADKETNELRADSAHGLYINGSGGGSGAIFDIQVNNVILDGLQLYCGGFTCVQVGNHATGVIVRNCIMRTTSGYCVSSAWAGAPAASVTIINSVATFTTGGAFNNSSNVMTCRNCTVVAIGAPRGGFGYYNNYGTFYCYNCAGVGVGTPYGCFYSVSSSGNNNASSDTTAPGTSYVRSVSESGTFQSFSDTYTSLDLRVTSATSVLKDAGANDSATNGVDICKRTRSSTAPTIGAWEYKSSEQTLNLSTAEPMSGTFTLTDTSYLMQILTPASDGSKGNWVASTGSNLYDMVNEDTPSDSDYIQSGTDPSNDACEIKLASGAAPSSTQATVLSYTICQSGGATTATVALYQGQPSAAGTLIASWSHTLDTDDTAFTRYDQQLTPTQAGNITDPTDLWLKFTAGA